MVNIALEPDRNPVYVKAIEGAGGVLSPLNSEVESSEVGSSEVRALVWTDYGDPTGLQRMLEKNPQLEWVQLPFAGVDAFAHLLHFPVKFTCAKGAYAEPVAEHALTLALALGRTIPERVQAKSWGRKFADSLFDTNVLIIGGGGIAEVLVSLLQPFRPKITVLRKHPQYSFHGSAEVLSFSEFDATITQAKFIFITCALTSETRNLFNDRAFKLMRSDSYLINVARGEIIDQPALIHALRHNEIAGAAIDVTYPEPLPDGHELWSAPHVLITPHTADTPELITHLFAERLRINVSAWIAGEALTGEVDPILGY